MASDNKGYDTIGNGDDLSVIEKKLSQDLAFNAPEHNVFLNGSDTISYSASRDEDGLPDVNLKNQLNPEEDRSTEALLHSNAKQKTLTLLANETVMTGEKKEELITLTFSHSGTFASGPKVPVSKKDSFEHVAFVSDTSKTAASDGHVNAGIDELDNLTEDLDSSKSISHRTSMGEDYDVIELQAAKPHDLYPSLEDNLDSEVDSVVASGEVFDALSEIKCPSDLENAPAGYSLPELAGVTEPVVSDMSTEESPAEIAFDPVLTLSSKSQLLPVKNPAVSEHGNSKNEESIGSSDGSGHQVNTSNIRTVDSLTAQTSSSQTHSDIEDINHSNCGMPPRSNDDPSEMGTSDKSIDFPNTNAEDKSCDLAFEINNIVVANEMLEASPEEYPKSEVFEHNLGGNAVSSSVQERTDQSTLDVGKNEDILEARASNDVPVDGTMSSPEPDWLDILGNSLLKKKIISKGKGQSTRPIAGQEVVVSFAGSLEDGIIVDSSSSLDFVLGDEDVIQAFDLAVALMELDEEAVLYTDARYAYSIYGRPDLNPPIPQNANLTYKIKLLSVRDGPSMRGSLADSERAALGDKKRTRGNDLYARGDFSGAVNSYKRGLKYLEGSSAKDVLDLRIKILNNLSAAQLKVKAYAMALQSLSTVLAQEPDNVKALFRQAKCLDALGKDDEALTCLKKASMLDPQNKLILQDLARVRARVSETTKKEKEMYQRMFSQSPKEVKSPASEGKNWTMILTSVVAVVGGVALALFWHRHR